jgi:hypothetical protein
MLSSAPIYTPPPLLSRKVAPVPPPPDTTKLAERPTPRNVATTPSTPNHRRVIFPTLRNNQKYHTLVGSFPMANVSLVQADDTLCAPNLNTTTSNGPCHSNCQEGQVHEEQAVVSQPPSREHRERKNIQHEYRNHLLSFASLVQSLPLNWGEEKDHQEEEENRDGTQHDMKKRSSILPKIPVAPSPSPNDESTVVSGATDSTVSTTGSQSTANGSENSIINSRSRSDPFHLLSSPHRSSVLLKQRRQLNEEDAPPLPFAPPVDQGPQTATASSASNPTTSRRMTPLIKPLVQPPKPPPLKSVLRKELKYAPEPLPPITRPKESSVPSLVSIKDDTDDDGSQSSSTSASHQASSLITTPESDTAGDGRATSAPLPKIISSSGTLPVAPVRPNPEESKEREDDLAAMPMRLSPRKVLFDPRVWIRVFHRAPEEADCTWYTNDDMEHFKRLALDRIVRYQSPTELIPTGTGRMVPHQRALTPWKGPIYSHAALTLDGENDNDEFMRRKVLEKELQSILIVDPQDLALKLFSKALKAVLPRTVHIATAKSSKEAFKQLEFGQRFDMFIVEERLRLFQRRQSSSSSSSTSSSLSTEPAQNTDPNSPLSPTLASGAALIDALGQSPVTSTSLFVGVSAHMEEDEGKLQKSGADILWPKPPPKFDQDLMEQLARTILIKRGRTILATELFGES